MSGSGTARIRVRLLREGAELPRRQSEGASGFDLRACPADGVSVEIGPAPVLVPTGIAVAAPPGTDLQIRPRSGLSARGVIAAFGTIDSDYRGELFVTMYCLSSAGIHVAARGDRIAQLAAAALLPAFFEEADDLDPTARGSGGHGSTGSR